MKILCLGDSLGLPREGVKYEDTWFYKIKKRFPEFEFIDYFKRGLLITDALHQFDTYYKDYEPDFVIIQTGICDCAPRIINENKTTWKIIIKIARILNKESLFWNILKRIKERDCKCVYTSYTDFYKNVERLVNNFLSIGVKNIIIIKIGYTTDKVLLKNNNINKNIKKYNVVYEYMAKKYSNKIRLIEPLNKPIETYFVDGYHCNKHGMNIVYEELVKCLNYEFYK